MPRVAFDTFTVQAPDGWVDITSDVTSEDAPYTLAHMDGVGALQFSVALKKAGPAPNPTPAVLWEMVEEFARKRGLGKPVAMTSEPGPVALAAGSFEWGEDFVRVWQISDGRNFAFVTYTCAAGSVGPELAACEQIVRSITFVPTANGPA
jgi:hypothetical protein